MTLENSILNWLAQHEPHAKLSRIWDLTGGLSSGMTAFEIEDEHKHLSRFVARQPSDWNLSQSPQAAKDEYLLLKYLQKQGIPAPVPVFLDTKNTFFQRQTLILTFIEAATHLSPSPLDSYLSQYANQLAAIHQSPQPSTRLPQLKKYRATLDDHPSEEEARLNSSFPYSKCKDALRAIWPIPRLNPASLLHGDYWPGNSLWKNDKLVAILDWEEACIDDPLIDLAISRLDVSFLFGKEAIDTFTEAYLKQNPTDTAHLTHWDLFAAIRPGDRLGLWATSYPLFGRPDITEESMTLSRRKFAEDALENT